MGLNCAVDRTMLVRIAVGLVFAPLIFVLFWLRGIPFVLFMLLISGIGQWELYGMYNEPVRLPQRILGHIVGAGIVADAYLFRAGHFIELFMTAVVLSFIIEIFDSRKNKFMTVIKSMFVVVYPAAFVTFLIRLAEHPPQVFGPDSSYIAVIVLVVIWVFDSASYFAGRFFGKRPFFPALSPKKTVEGFIGGLAGVLAAGMFLWLYFPDIGWNIFPMVIVVTLAGQVGDLSESLVKREMNAKDSSDFIPGHGGILDRFDSLFFAGPAVWLYLFLAERWWV